MAEISSKIGSTSGRTHTNRDEQSLRERLGVAKGGGRVDKVSVGAKIIDVLKTLAWVIPLTILLWVYAEREQVTPASIQHVPFQVRAAGADRIVTLISPSDHYLDIDVRGPRAGVEAVRTALSEGRVVLDLSVPEDLQPGFEGNVPATDRVARNEIFTTNAVTVVQARPSIRVRIQAKATRTAKVRLKPNEPAVTSATFTPETVTVEGPADEIASIPEDQLVAYADTSRFANQATGRYKEEIGVVLPFQREGVTATPAKVMAEMEIAQAQSHKLAIVPVKLEMPSAAVNKHRYDVELSVETLANVNVTGTRESIDALKNNRFIPAAIIELTQSDFQDLEPGKSVERIKRLRPENFRMPPGAVVTNKDLDVTVKITDRGT